MPKIQQVDDLSSDVSTLKEEVQETRLKHQILDASHNDTRSQKADRAEVVQLNTKVDEFVETDLRGNATFMEIKALNHRIMALESSAVPTKVSNLEFGQTWLNQTIALKADKSEVSALESSSTSETQNIRQNIQSRSDAID